MGKVSYHYSGEPTFTREVADDGRVFLRQPVANRHLSTFANEARGILDGSLAVAIRTDKGSARWVLADGPDDQITMADWHTGQTHRLAREHCTLERLAAHWYGFVSPEGRQ